MTSLEFYNFVKEQISQSQLYKQKKNIDKEDFKFLHFEFKDTNYDNTLDLILNSKKAVVLKSFEDDIQDEPFSGFQLVRRRESFHSYKTYFFIKWRKEGIYIKSGISEIKNNKKGQLYLSSKRHLTIIYKEKEKRFLFSYKFGKNLITQTLSLKNWENLYNFLLCANNFDAQINKSIVFKMVNLQFQSEFIEKNLTMKPYSISNEYVKGISSLKEFEKRLFGFETGTKLSFEELIIVFLNIKPNNYKDFFEFYINKKDKVFKQFQLLKDVVYIRGNDIFKVISFFFFEKINQKIFEGKFSTDSKLNNLIRKEYLRFVDVYLHKIFSRVENKIEVDFQTLEELENTFLEKFIVYHVEMLKKPVNSKFHKLGFKFSKKIERKFLFQCYDLYYILSKNDNRVEFCQIYNNNNSERYTVVVEIGQNNSGRIVGIFSKKEFNKRTISSILKFMKKTYDLKEMYYKPINVELTNEQRWISFLMNPPQDLLKQIPFIVEDQGIEINNVDLEIF